MDDNAAARSGRNSRLTSIPEFQLLVADALRQTAGSESVDGMACRLEFIAYGSLTRNRAEEARQAASSISKHLTVGNVGALIHVPGLGPATDWDAVALSRRLAELALKATQQRDGLPNGSPCSERPPSAVTPSGSNAGTVDERPMGRQWVSVSASEKKPAYPILPIYDGFRQHDTEAVLINALVERIPTPSGRVALFTERAPCPSCIDILKRFKSDHQTVDLSVYCHTLKTWLPPDNQTDAASALEALKAGGIDVRELQPGPSRASK